MVAVGKGVVGARERARLAKVKRYADQVAHQQKVEDAATEFYVAADAYEAALTAMAAARAAMARQVEILIGDLKEPVAGVAVLCDLTATQVRALRKEATVAGAAGSTADAATAAVRHRDSTESSAEGEAGTSDKLEQNGVPEEPENVNPDTTLEQKQAS